MAANGSIFVRVPGSRSLDDLVAQLRVAAARFEADVSRVVDTEGRRVEREIERQWPDRGSPGWLHPTGYSRSRWRWEKVGKLAWDLHNSARYAAFVHPPGVGVTLRDSVVRPAIARGQARMEDQLRRLLKAAVTTPATRSLAARGRL